MHVTEIQKDRSDRLKVMGWENRGLNNFAAIDEMNN